jgi:hypothetical protein
MCPWSLLFFGTAQGFPLQGDHRLRCLHPRAVDCQRAGRPTRPGAPRIRPGSRGASWWEAWRPRGWRGGSPRPARFVRRSCVPMWRWHHSCTRHTTSLSLLGAYHATPIRQLNDPVAWESLLAQRCVPRTLAHRPDTRAPGVFGAPRVRSASPLRVLLYAFWSHRLRLASVRGGAHMAQ